MQSRAAAGGRHPQLGCQQRQQHRPPHVRQLSVAQGELLPQLASLADSQTGAAACCKGAAATLKQHATAPVLGRSRLQSSLASLAGHITGLHCGAKCKSCRCKHVSRVTAGRFGYFRKDTSLTCTKGMVWTSCRMIRRRQNVCPVACLSQGCVLLDARYVTLADFC